MNKYEKEVMKIGTEEDIKKLVISSESLEKHDLALIKNWNERVKETDTIFFLGDFCFRNSKGGKVGEGTQTRADYYISKLNGRKVFISGNHDCFSQETRLLTKEGYKYYWEVNEGDLIPTVNLNNKKVEFKPIKKIIINKVDKAYEFKTRTAKGCFSYNHKHLYSFGTSDNLPIKITTSEKLWKYKSPIRLLDSFQSGYKNYNITDNWLKLLAWILTDGGILKKYNYITIYQSKKKNVDRIIKIMKNLNIKYTTNKRQRNTKYICGRKLRKKPKMAYEFRILAESSRRILKKLFLKDKYILPKWIWNLSDNQCKIFIKELIKGDGSIGNTNTKVLWGKKIFLEQVMGLCVTHNLKSNLTKDCRNHYYLTISSRIKNREKEFTYKSIMPNKRKIISYNESMWCVNVQNHVIFIELDGKTLITGNSNNSLKTILKEAVIEIADKKIRMLHNPYFANSNFKLHFCGHVHTNFQFKRTYFNAEDYTDIVNVGIDVWQYRPIDINEIFKHYYRWRNSLEKENKA